MFFTGIGKFEMFAMITGFAGLMATSRTSFRNCDESLAFVAAVGEIAKRALTIVREAGVSNALIIEV